MTPPVSPSPPPMFSDPAAGGKPFASNGPRPLLGVAYTLYAAMLVAVACAMLPARHPLHLSVKFHGETVFEKVSSSLPERARTGRAAPGPSGTATQRSEPWDGDQDITKMDGWDQLSDAQHRAYAEIWERRREARARVGAAPQGQPFEDKSEGLATWRRGWDERAGREALAPGRVRPVPPLAAMPLPDAPPIVDTSVPEPPVTQADVRASILGLLEESFVLANPPRTPIQEGMLEGWIVEHPLGPPLRMGAPDGWSPRRGFGVDTTVAPPVFVLPDGAVWENLGIAGWNMSAQTLAKGNAPRVLAVRAAGRSGMEVAQLTLDGDLLRIMTGFLGRDGTEKEGTAQEVLAPGWSAIMGPRTVVQTVLVDRSGGWLLRVVSPEQGALAFVRFSPDGGTPPVATGVLFQDFAAMPGVSSVWKGPEEVWKHLPWGVAEEWNTPVPLPFVSHRTLQSEDSGSYPAVGAVALDHGPPGTGVWLLNARFVGYDGVFQPDPASGEGSDERFFAPEVVQGRVPAIVALPGEEAVAMWIPTGQTEPWAWVVGVNATHVAGAPLPHPRKVAFNAPAGLGLEGILRVERAHVWSDGAALLRVEMGDGTWRNLLWHMPSGAVVVMGTS